jgi:hypothetical protein
MRRAVESQSPTKLASGLWHKHQRASPFGQRLRCSNTGWRSHQILAPRHQRQGESVPIVLLDAEREDLSCAHTMSSPKTHPQASAFATRYERPDSHVGSVGSVGSRATELTRFAVSSTAVRGAGS